MTNAASPSVAFSPRVPALSLFHELDVTPYIATHDDYRHYRRQLDEMLDRLRSSTNQASAIMTYALILRLGDFELANDVGSLEAWGELIDAMVVPETQ